MSSKKEKQEAAPDRHVDQVSVAEPAKNDIRLSLHEFCIRLSKEVHRTELIGAFEHTERRAKRLNDLESAYRARFEEFTNKTV